MLDRWPNIKFIFRSKELKDSQKVVSEVDSPQAQFTKWGNQIKKLPKDVIKLGLEILDNV
jgi:hypothetical protein